MEARDRGCTIGGRGQGGVRSRHLPPASEGSYEGVAPRVLRTPFVERWNAERAEARRSAAELGREVLGAILAGRGHEYLPFSGQTVGMIDEVLPAREIVRLLVEGAERALARAS